MKINEKFAKAVKSFIEDKEEHKKGDSKQFGKTLVWKDNEGCIIATIEGKRFLIIDTNTSDPYEGFELINRKVVDRLNALKDAMNWEFALVWENRKPHAIDSWGGHVRLKTDRHYSIGDLADITYS